MRRKRGFLQISFQWLFAIIVGIFILFLTIYGITRLIRTEERVQDITTSEEIGILLNPLETGFEEAKTAIIEFDGDTRIYNTCDEFGNFGTQEIEISQKSFGKWSERSGGVIFYNKYIFSKYPVEGRDMYIFSKPFEFPFKVANLIYMISSNDIYCFIDAPEDIQEEINNLNLNNLKTENCSELGTNVCFNDDCEISVNYNLQYVKKDNERIIFESDALMYASIFSDVDVYECQLKRLMKRTSSLAELYIDKANLVKLEGCDTNLNTDLELLINQAQALEDSDDLLFVADIVDDIDMKNKNARCRLF